MGRVTGEGSIFEWIEKVKRGEWPLWERRERDQRRMP